MQPNGKRTLFWRIVRLSAGWALLVLGVIGLFLPILQGLIFIASGLALLSTDLPWAKNLLDRLSRWRKGRKGAQGHPTPPKSSKFPPDTPF